MATPPKVTTLNEKDLQIKDAAVDGKALRDAFRREYSVLNPFFSSLNQLAAKGITLSENVQCDIVVGSFSHGVAQTVALKTLTQAKGALVVGCDGQIAKYASVQMSQQIGSNPLANVTVFFENILAASVTTAILLLPEGQQTSSTPAGATYVIVDSSGQNNGIMDTGGTLPAAGAAVVFGGNTGEGIASKRTSGGNQFGLDFYTNYTSRQSINNSGLATFTGRRTAGVNGSNVLEIGSTFPMALVENWPGVGFNCNNDGVSTKYLTTNPAGLIQLDNTGAMRLYVAASGTAGTAVSLGEAIKIVPGPTTSIAQPAYTAASFQNTWSDWGGGLSTCAYWKDSVGVVHIKGIAKAGASSAANVIFTLPVGYRPTELHQFAVTQYNGASNIFGLLQVDGSGNVYPNFYTGGVGGNISLCGISFKAEQ